VADLQLLHAPLNLNLPGPLLRSELWGGGLAPRPPRKINSSPVFSVADMQLLQSPLNLQGPLLISELLEVRAGGAGG